MRKVILIILTAMLCLGLFCVPSHAAEPVLDAETAEAYANVLINNYGGDGDEKWVRFARVMDMDGDGNVELIVICTEGDDGAVNLWDIKNDMAQRVITDDFVGPVSVTASGIHFLEVNLITDGTNTYVHVSEPAEGHMMGSGSFYDMDEDTVIGLDGIKFNSKYYHYVDNYIDEDGVVRNSGETFENGVTKEEHDQKVESYFNGKTIEKINLDDYVNTIGWREKEHAPSYKETMRQLLTACIRTDNTATASKYGTYQIIDLSDSFGRPIIVSLDAAMVEKKTISACNIGSVDFEYLLEQGNMPDFSQREVTMVTVRPDSNFRVIGGEHFYGKTGFLACDIEKITDSSFGFADGAANCISSGVINDGPYNSYSENSVFISKEWGIPIYTEDATYLIFAGDPVPALPFTIDYAQAATFTKPQQYLDALTDALADAERLTDEGNANLTTYLNYATVNSAGVTISAKNNIAEIPEAKAGEVAARARETYETLKAIVDEHGIDFQRAPEVTARIHIAGLDWSKPVQFQIDREALSAAEGADVLLITLGDLQHTVRICPSDFKGASGVILQIEPIDENEYHIAFLDENGNLLDRIQTPVTIALPAPDKLATVQAVHAGATDNWGGQYDAQNGSIAFQTAFSGDYTVLEQPVQISDIENLSEEQQAIIAFMVSKGYFSTDKDGNFNPNKILSRYHLAAALVRIFFALDRDLEATFSDVPKDSIYYPYVASGQANDIINGFEDGTYRGDSDVLRSQLIALCSRTLANKKGYAYPENVEAYLNFADKDAIKEWARKEVALAVREGLIESGGNLEPERPITRAEAAEMLYRLFMLLYEVSPAPMTEVEETEIVELDSSETQSENRNIVMEPENVNEHTTSVSEEKAEQKKSASPLAGILVSIGGIAILAGGVILMKKQRKQT